MADKDIFFVNGYRFSSLQDAQLAEEEIKKADYFKSRTNGKSPRKLLAVYDKILDEKVFKTPVGWEYLRQVQSDLKQAGIGEEEIRPIPMYSSFAYKTGEEMDHSFVRQRIKPVRKKEGKINKFQVSLIINILLAVLVLTMFVITLKSDNPNILNYKQNLINQYASWEQELTERENAVREKERELQINP